MSVTVREIPECSELELAAALNSIFDAGGNVIQVLGDPAHGKVGHADIWIISEDFESVALTVSGIDDNVPLTTWQDVWPSAGDVPDTEDAREFEIVSTSVLDTGAGTGIQSVDIGMIRTDFSVLNQTVVLAGTTPVAIPGGPFMHCTRIRAATAGAGGRAAGPITVEDTPGGSVYHLIDLGSTAGERAWTIIPTGVSFALLGWGIALGTTNPQSALNAELQVRPPGGAWWALDVAPQLDETFRQYNASVFAAAAAGMRFRVQAFSARADELVTTKMDFGAAG